MSTPALLAYMPALLGKHALYDIGGIEATTTFGTASLNTTAPVNVTAGTFNVSFGSVTLGAGTSSSAFFMFFN